MDSEKNEKKKKRLYTKITGEKADTPLPKMSKFSLLETKAFLIDVKYWLVWAAVLVVTIMNCNFPISLIFRLKSFPRIVRVDTRISYFRLLFFLLIHMKSHFRECRSHKCLSTAALNSSFASGFCFSFFQLRISDNCIRVFYIFSLLCRSLFKQCPHSK